MRKVIKHAKLEGLNLPPSPWDSTRKLCPLYHIKGLCNACCGQYRHHQPHQAGSKAPLF